MSVLAKDTTQVALMVILLAASAPRAAAEPLTICEVQYTTNPDGRSDYDGHVIDCTGGIVVAKFEGNRPRLILADPNPDHYPQGSSYSDGWGGIQVKDGIYPYDMFNEAQIGDWIQFTNMLVEEYRDTTFLQRQLIHNPGYTIVSRGNPLPPPVPVSVSDIPAPIYDPGEGGWFVEDHEAERYESMRLLVRDVTITERFLGKADDNYNLEYSPGESCWASDYMNEDAEWDPEHDAYFHPFQTMGQHFCALVGVFEQYKYSNDWDYYQLLTNHTADLAVCGNLDCATADVDINDVPAFVSALIAPDGYLVEYPDCNILSADMNCDGTVDGRDVQLFVDLLLEGAP